MKSSVKHLSIIIVTAVLVFGLSISFQSLLADWSNPAGTPPDLNVLQPIFNAGTLDFPVIDHYLTVNDNFAVGTSSLVVNNSNGRVGIGVLLPKSTLDIGSGTLSSFYDSGVNPQYIGNNSIYLESNNPGIGLLDNTNGNGWGYNISASMNGSLRFLTAGTSTAGTPRVSFDPNGNVGIGTTSPTNKLEVAGNVKASGDICNGTGDCIGSSSSSTFKTYTVNFSGDAQTAFCNGGKTIKFAEPGDVDICSYAGELTDVNNNDSTYVEAKHTKIYKDATGWKAYAALGVAGSCYSSLMKAFVFINCLKIN